MNTPLRIVALCGVALALTAAAPAPRAALEDAVADFSGWLNNGASRNHTMSLRRGVGYTFTGGCDGDCTDLDLRLYDNNGNLIDSDVLPDDYPIVSVTPRWNGNFRLRVTMARCTVNPCQYEVTVE